jgi:hypothetical protein
MQDDREGRIRARAHIIWEQEGRSEGRDKQHWDRAAKEVDLEDSEGDGQDAGTKPDILKTTTALR